MVILVKDRMDQAARDDTKQLAYYCQVPGLLFCARY